MTLTRRKVYEECNFAFPLRGYAEFEANPDIAGIGVLLSFIITSCLAYAIVLAAYYFVQSSYNEGLITDLDHEVAERAQGLLKHLTKYGGVRLDRIRATIITSKLLFKVLLSFSDQQMVTGFAMLTVGLVQIKSITEYHFAIVSNLSILSVVVQDTTAVILQDDIVRHRMTRHWRGVVVIASMVITIAIQLPDGHYYSMEDYGLPVKCIWASMEGNYRPRSRNFWLMIIWMAILLYILVDTLCVYFPNTFGRLMDNTVVKATKAYIMGKVLAARDTYEYRAQRPQRSVVDRCLTSLAKHIAICIFVITEVLYSQAFRMQVRWMIMTNSMYYIFLLRSTASDNGRQGDEDEWGFGQAVPMFLLILPLATIMETTWGSLMSPIRDGLLATIPISTLCAPNTETSISRAVRFESAGYYFGYKKRSRTWDMERRLYDSSHFKSMMLFVLIVTFACWTTVAFYL